MFSNISSLKWWTTCSPFVLHKKWSAQAFSSFIYEVDVRIWVLNLFGHLLFLFLFHFFWYHIYFLSFHFSVIEEALTNMQDYIFISGFRLWIHSFLGKQKDHVKMVTTCWQNAWFNKTKGNHFKEKCFIFCQQSIMERNWLVLF